MIFLLKPPFIGDFPAIDLMEGNPLLPCFFWAGRAARLEDLILGVAVQDLG